MSNFSAHDSIFVTVYYLGCRMMSVSLSGITSQAELMSGLRAKLKKFSGKLLTLETRNATQGWSHTAPVLFAA